MRTPLLTLSVLFCLGTTARADTARTREDEVKDAAIRVIKGKTVPIRGSINAVAIGYDPGTRLSAHATAGYAWGTTNSGLLGKTSVHHICLVPRMSIEASGDRDFRASAGLTAGHTWARGLAFGIEGGADVQLFGGVAFGPMAKLRVGVGPVALYLMSWGHVAGEGDVGVSIGFELFRLPSLSTFERARYSAEAAVGP